MSEQTPATYALLIGINYYIPNRLYRSLNGAVGDVELVEDYLKNTVHPKRIWKLTSSNPDISDIRSAQEPTALPTYDNIIKAFNEITEIAQQNDLVYIHYSGHGGRAITTYQEIKGEGQYDEAIVPMDIGNEENRYIRDVEMTTLLKRMTDKGLIVTFVLDSCHSGGATRGDVDIRSSEEDDSQPRSAVGANILGESREKLIETWMKVVESPQDKNAVVLAACRPTEFAYEAPFEGKKHGALTYWMLDTLKSGGSALTFKSLYDRISAKIQSRFRDQLPMLQGQDTRFIFGSAQAAVQYAVTVGKVDRDQQTVTVNAGIAQGLQSGTRLAIYPLNTIDFADKQKRVAIVEVTEDDIQASSAVAKILPAEESGVELHGEVEVGAPAIVLSAPPDLVRRVRLIADKKLGDKDNELPTQALVDQQEKAIAAVQQALKENGWVVEVKEGEHYQVAVGRNGEYEISTGMPLNSLKAPKIDQPNAVKEVVERLVHLAKYQAVQELDNSSSELKDALEFELCDINKKPLPNSGNHSALGNNERVFLRVKNISKQSLNIAVLDLAPDWSISQFPVQGQEGQFFQLVSDAEIFIGKIRLVFPEGEGETYQQGVPETFKLFATRGPADFRWLRLPPIDQSLQSDERSATRGIDSPLAKLLEAVGGDPDAEPSMTRAVLEPDPSAEFVTKQIHIMVKP
ncbi:caspase family protein [Leptolyngbya ohadii]|uniref:caspase family protein n=1 Tax=Leptolyngbya ohadii TaxID=1962290 RepID=UPI000B59F98C|nr:caspase family protein [Leptolyngbya ohadii]